MKTIACTIFLALVASPALGEPEVSDIFYYLFTRQNKDHDARQVIKINDAKSLKDSSFDGNRPTKFLIHGWFGGISSPMATWLEPLKDALLEKEDLNIIYVDWGKIAWMPFYVKPARHTRFVGRITAQFVEFLERVGGASRKDLHLIGHSLGGQVSGFVGKHLNPKPARISGMDTAEYGFDKDDVDDTLDPSDADFVDEIHTLVSYSDKGHADFYPNGGHNPTPIKIYEHSHAWKFYLMSVKAGDCAFKSFKCKDYDKFQNGCKTSDGNHMGYHAFKPTTPTKYYLDADPSNTDEKVACKN